MSSNGVQMDFEVLAARLRSFEAAGLYADAGSTFLVCDDFDPVVHELAHLVLLPLTYSNGDSGRDEVWTSDQLDTLIQAFPTMISNRLEIATWLVERRVAQRFGVRFSLKEAIKNAMFATHTTCAQTKERLERLGFRWSRQIWVNEAAEETIGVLMNGWHRLPLESMAPLHVWEGRERS